MVRLRKTNTVKGTTGRIGRPKGSKDKKPRKKPEHVDRSNMKTPIAPPIDLPEGYNAKMIAFMREIVPTEPLDLNDIPEMERRFSHYLEMCEKYDIKIGNQAAYTAIGVDKQQIWYWVHGNPGQKINQKRMDFAKKVQQICSMYRENLMADGKVNPVTGIFWQKNYDGMKDQQEVVLTPNNPLGESQNTEDLKQKYLDNIGEITDSTKQAFIEQSTQTDTLIDSVSLLSAESV